MIWIKYCTDSWSERPVTAEAYCEKLSRCIGRKREGRDAPLRDSLSKIYMHEFMFAHMAKRDCYSVIFSDGSRIPMYALPQKDRFVLAVLNDSQYSRKPGLAWEPLDDARWHFLSNLDLIIWLEATGEDFRNAGDRLCGNEPCEIHDFPYYGKSVDVTVLPGKLSEQPEIYERIDEPRRYVPESALHIGPDGEYYTDCASLREAFSNCWMTDIEYTIKRLECKIKRIWYLTNIMRKWRIEDFEKLSVCEPEILPEQHASCKIITHMISVPPTPDAWVAVWKIDKKTDGTYYLHGGSSEPYAGFGAAIRCAMDERSAEYERMELLVLDDFGDGQNFEVYFGMKIYADCIEVFEKNLAAEMFHEALYEAWHSGHCVTQTPCCE